MMAKLRVRFGDRATASKLINCFKQCLTGVCCCCCNAQSVSHCNEIMIALRQGCMGKQTSAVL
jgi:hypothetical protein